MRYPAVAGRFYPSEGSELISEIEACFEHPLGPGRIGERKQERRIKGALVPHAGYACSGMNAAHAFKRIAEDGRPDAYVVIGPDHYGIPYDIALCTESYLTPLGECRVDGEICRRLSRAIPVSTESHSLEHSVEVEVPFIQYIDPDAKIVPVIMSDQSYESAVRLGEAVREACEGFDAIVLASSDLCHYIPKHEAEKKDRAYMDAVCSLDIRRMYSLVEGEGLTVCGYGPTAAMMCATQPVKAESLKLSDSWDSIHCQKNSVVGYGSAIFE